jgi:hypothetical protein
MNRKGRASRSKRGRWEKTVMRGRCERSGTLVWGRPCPRKSGGSDPPCGRDSEKGEDDVEYQETVDLKFERLNLPLDRVNPARYSL